MADVTRVLVGLEDFDVLDADEEDGRLVVMVRVARGEAPCPRCAVFSERVKQTLTYAETREVSLDALPGAHFRRLQVVCRL